MEKIYTKFNRVRPLAEKVALKYKGELSFDLDIGRIYFCAVEGMKGRFLAQCRRITEPYWTMLREKYDFVILYNMDMIEYRLQMSKASKKQKTRYLKLITLHELMHIGEEGKLRRHDREDFAFLLKKFGIDWVARGGLLKTKGEK